MITEEIRSYEVSVWTLLDEFITVLKWSDIEQKGRIENPKMILNIDGTLTFEFSIPMFYYEDGEWIDNPNWYNTLNGNLLEGLRKIKVIFNKEELSTMSVSEFEAAAPLNVFEFLIMKMTDSHEKDIASCDIKCEGLAFHELGKIGYKISLSQENFEIKYKKWAESDKSEPEPLLTLDYWCGDETTCNLPLWPGSGSQIDPKTWYYTVCMDWTSFKNDTTDPNRTRLSTQIYEEAFPTNWDPATLIPTSYLDYRVKARSVKADKSNLYNLTLTIAEAFLVHCKYLYTYDSNYHITSRTIIFYNHFFLENEGAMSFTYPYSSSKITRDSDCTNLTTKLYVLTTDNDKTVAGYNTIMNASANPTHEDYILNFDYMLDRGIISLDLYDDIKPYEIKMRDYNKQLITLLQNLATYNVLKPEIAAKIKVYLRSIEIDNENIALNSALAKELDIKDGEADDCITLNENNPDSRVVSEDENKIPYVNLLNTNKGILTDTVHIYRNYNSATHTLSNEDSNFVFEYDEYGRPTKILGVTPASNSNTVHLTYKYKPSLYYDAVVKVWSTKLGNDEGEYAHALSELGPESEDDVDFDLAGVYTFYAKELDIVNLQYTEATDENKHDVLIHAYNKGLNKKINETTNQIETLIGLKAADIKEFERSMGAALREGYWQPEDYKDYGINKNDEKSLTIIPDANIDTEESFIAFWDTELFNEENKNYYEESVTLDKKYYPCIDLYDFYNDNNSNFRDNLMNYSFIFNNNYNNVNAGVDDTRFTQVFRIGSGALLEFGKIDNVIHPLLVLVGAKSMSDGSNNSPDEIAFMEDSTKGHPRLAIIDEYANGTYTFIGNPIEVHNKFVNGALYTTVYPRIKFSSLNLRADSSDLIIRYENNLLEVAKDYTVLTRNTLRTVNSLELYYSEYFLTIDPEVLYRNKTYTGQFNIHYILSNADNQIYLDALEVAKENAYPKVEYTVDPNILNRDLSKILYLKLATLVMINDVKLKLENVFGYISKVELDLDNVSKDLVEVKNYTGKFEDLFSTIVAQTELMKLDSALFHAAMEGQVPLETKTLEQTLALNDIIMLAYLDSYFDSSEVVRARLESLFTEAGEILGNSNKTLNKMLALTLENASILAGFVENITEELTPKVYRLPNKPDNFKVGDLWIDSEGNHYVATSSSSESIGGGSAGFVKTHDGTLASITGAGMDIDADSGTVNIYAANELSLRSGKHIYIGADDAVDIVGNKSVNIGGCTINIVAESSGNIPNGGINLISTGVDISSNKNLPNVNVWQANHTYHENEYVSVLVNSLIKYYKCISEHISGDSFSVTNWNIVPNTIEETINSLIADTTTSSLSKVLIHPDKIDMAGANITMRGGNGIKLITSRGDSNSTNAISLDPDDGIYIGSGRGITLYSGSTSVTNETINYSLSSGSGASVLLNSEHLILGYAADSSTTAIEMTDQYMVIAKGNIIVPTGTDLLKAATTLLKTTTGVTGTNSGLIGARFTDTSIGFAVGSGGSISAILMNSTNGITIGSGSIDVTLPTTGNNGNNLRASSGSYVRIASTGIELGSLADLYINMNNFKLLTDILPGESTATTRFAVGSGLHNIDSSTADGIGTAQESFIGMVYNSHGLFVSGDITATSFRLIGSPFSANYIEDTSLLTKITNNTTVLSALSTANTITENMSPILTYGLIGYKSVNGTAFTGTDTDGVIYTNGYPVYFTQQYGLVLGNNTDKPLLIGSNGGIHLINVDTQNNTSSTAVVIDHTGIDIKSGGNFNIVTNNLTINSNPTNNGDNYFYVGDSGNNPNSYIKYVKGASGNTFEVKGAITATSLMIGTQTAEQYIQAHLTSQDLSPYATWSAFTVALADESKTGSARIIASVWNTMGNGTSLKMTDGTFLIGTTSGSTFTSSVTINNDGIVLASNKTLLINTTNFTIDSNGDVTVKGTIEADSGSIAGWTLDPEFLRTGTNSDKGLMVTLVGANATRHNDIITHPVGEYNTNYLIGDNNNLTIELNQWAMYAGAKWPEDAPGYAPYQTPARGGTGDDKDLGWAPFRVKRNGETYIKDLCIGNGPSTLGTNTVSYEYWHGYEGHMWFWVKGTDDQGKRCYKWIEIDGLALYNMLEDVATLWNRTIGGGTYAKSTTNEIAVATNTLNSSGGCFIKGTLIHLADGQLIPIETLLLGMKVLSYDADTLLFCAKEVMTVLAIRHKNLIYDLYLSNGKIITVTNSHPFLTVDGWKAIDPEWAWHDHKVETTILQENDELINISNNKIYIKKILYRTDLQDETVYSCGIEDTHTFIVEGVVVHNVFVATALKS